MSESLQRNTNSWIDTAKDALFLGVAVGGLLTTCGPAIQNDTITSNHVIRASQHAKSAGEALERIYNRACDMAVNNSYDLLLAIDSDEKTSQNLTVTTAAKEHRNDLKKFQQKEVNVKIPHKIHANLFESLIQTEENLAPNVRVAAERSSRAWNIAKSIGMIALTASIILGFAISKA